MPACVCVSIWCHHSTKVLSSTCTKAETHTHLMAVHHLQKMSGMLHFSTRRHRTSTSPPFTANWAQTSPFCLKPPHPRESSWKTWASETSFGSNWAVSKTLWVRCLIWTSLWCDTSWVRKDHPGNERFNSAGSVFSVWESTSVCLNPWEILLFQQHCHLLFLLWEITAASLLKKKQNQVLYTMSDNV